MTTKTAKVNARVEPKLKEDAERVLDALGLSTTDAIRVFFKQIVHLRGIPFEVRLPNRTTRKAMEQARTSQHLKSFHSAENHFKSHQI